MINLDRYWEAVQEKVCDHCIDGDGAGGCRLPRGQECELKARFPKIVKAIRSVTSIDVQPYANAIRRNVCISCRHQSAEGLCSLRTQLDCGLDRYLILAIEAIESVDATPVGLLSVESTGPSMKVNTL